MAKQKLVLAIDPFVETKANLRVALATVASIAVQLNASVTAATVISPDRLQWPVDFEPSWKSRFEIVGEKEIAKALKGPRSQAFQKKIIFQPLNSSSQSLAALVGFADEARASSIVVLTHEHIKPRFHLAGSFTSRLIHKSNAPVLAIDVRAKSVSRIRRIVLATSFSKSEKKQLASAIEWAKKFDAELILLNVLIGLPPNFLDGEFLAGGAERLRMFMDDQTRTATADAKSWSALAKRAGVRTGYHIVSASESPAEVIVKFARQNRADLIMMSSSTGPRTAVFLGSVCRDVLKKAKRNVLILK